MGVHGAGGVRESGRRRDANQLASGFLYRACTRSSRRAVSRFPGRTTTWGGDRRRSSEPPAVSGERASRSRGCLGATAAIPPRTRQRAEACCKRKPSNDRFLPTASEPASVTRAGWERKRSAASKRGRAPGSLPTLTAARPSPVGFQNGGARVSPSADVLSCVAFAHGRGCTFAVLGRLERMGNPTPRLMLTSWQAGGTSRGVPPAYLGGFDGFIVQRNALVPPSVRTGQSPGLRPARLSLRSQDRPVALRGDVTSTST